MATSSITHHFVFSGEAAERFANAVEASWQDAMEERKHPKPQPQWHMTTPEEVPEMLAKWRVLNAKRLQREQHQGLPEVGTSDGGVA